MLFNADVAGDRGAGGAEEDAGERRPRAHTGTAFPYPSSYLRGPLRVLR